MAQYATMGVTLVEIMPTGDPVAFTDRVGETLVSRLAELG
jgi:hypothetical protein